jgi:hypothetical protein
MIIQVIVCDHADYSLSSGSDAEPPIYCERKIECGESVYKAFLEESGWSIKQEQEYQVVLAKYKTIEKHYCPEHTSV